MEKGMVFNIQRYSLHDGAGLRTLVFMKGCPLRCLWCANPEGQPPQKTLFFQEKKCCGCRKCVERCPTGASAERSGLIVWDKTRCTECMECVKVCPTGARSVCGREYTVAELASVVERDSIFYRGHGGVTVGGGEPLLQADFVSQFLKACKEEYAINTAIETSSYATWEKASSVFDYVDIFQMDIKHMDSAEHMRLTGVPNAPILANIQRVAQTYDFSKRTMIIRVPVIPGLNSSEENIAATAEFVRRLEVVKRVELLPYHSYGAAKYERTKWSGSYQLNALAPTAPDELMERLAALVKSFGLTVKIGG